MTVEDVEIAAKWPDFKVKNGHYRGKESRGLFVETLLDAGFLEQVDTGLKWHDWDEHQRWVVNEGSRKEYARAAAKASWDARRSKLDALSAAHKVIATVERMEEECGAHAERMPDAMRIDESRIAPSPSPSPIPSPTHKSSAAKRGMRIPDDFAVTEAHRKFATQFGYPDPDVEIHKFRDHWMASAQPNARKLDWHAAFRTWLSRAGIYGVANGKNNRVNQPAITALTRAERYARTQRNGLERTGEAGSVVGEEPRRIAGSDANTATRKALGPATIDVLPENRR